jgi:hypothetical protein
MERWVAAATDEGPVALPDQGPAAVPAGPVGTLEPGTEPGPVSRSGLLAVPAAGICGAGPAGVAGGSGDRRIVGGVGGVGGVDI